MTFSTSLQTILVTGTLGVYGPETAATEVADPTLGSITFTPSATLVDVASNQVLYPNPVTVNLQPSDNGALSVRLAATDDPQITPSGWHWTAVENFTNATGTTFTFNLPIAAPGGQVKYASIRGGSAGDVTSSSFVPISEKGAPGGVASLDAEAQVPVVQLGTGSTGGGTRYLSDQQTWTVPAGGAGTSDPNMGGDLSGTASNAQIIANAVGPTELAANAVTTAKIADGNVTAPKVADASLTTAKLAAGFTLAENQVSLASDAAAGTPSRRSLGAGGTQAAAGNHAHATDAPRSETIRVFDHGADPLAARPTGYAQVYWTGSVRPSNMTEDDLWNDPAGNAEFETLQDEVYNGNPFGGSPASGSFLTWNSTTTEWAPSYSPTTPPAESMVSWNGLLGWIAEVRDTRRQIAIRSPGLTADTWTNMPNAKTELFGLTGTNAGLHRAVMDLRAATNVRLCVRVTVAGFAGSTLRAEYSTDNGTTWAYLSQAAGTSGGSTPSALLTTAGTISGAWAVLHANAQIETCLVRLVGVGGDGVVDPQFGNIYIETR